MRSSPADCALLSFHRSSGELATGRSKAPSQWSFEEVFVQAQDCNPHALAYASPHASAHQRCYNLLPFIDKFTPQADALARFWHNRRRHGRSPLGRSGNVAGRAAARLRVQRWNLI